MDRLDQTLADRGIVDMVVSVLTDNTDALRFYERRGLIPVETYLWRIADLNTTPPLAPQTRPEARCHQNPSRSQ